MWEYIQPQELLQVTYFLTSSIGANVMSLQKDTEKEAWIN